MKSDRIDQFRKQLQEWLADLEKQSDISSEKRAPVALDQQSVGRVSRIDAIQQQAMSLAQEQQRSKEIQRISVALRRISDDTFGYCDDCGGEIAEGRLNVDPSVSLCVHCAP